MSNSMSRWDALRVWATAMIVVLCSALGSGTAHADEILREKLEPATSVAPTATPVTREPATTGTSTDQEQPKKKEEKKKRQESADANVPQIGAVTTPSPQQTPAAAASAAQPESAGIADVTAPVKPTQADGDSRQAVPSESSPALATSIKSSEASPIDPSILPDPAIVDPIDSPAVEADVADEPWTGERTIALLTERALAHGSAVYEVLAVARCETGYTFMPWRDNGYLRRGSLGEVGVGQWLPPVERNHWGRTPHWREHQYHILAGYTQGDPDAIWWDADALAWSMGPGAPAGFKSGWSCWRMRGPWWFV